MSDLIKFSIITIAYNIEDEIECTMRSVLEQNYANIEYIIVDGKSKDKTVEIIQKYIPVFEHKGISVKFVSERDKGISDAFNKGIHSATGDVIGLINAGDGLMPGALSALANAWKNNDQIIYGKTLAVDKKYNLCYLRKIPNNFDLSKMVYDGLIFTHQSAFVKRDVYLTYGIYDIDFKYIMDSDLFIHFYKSGVNFRYLDFVLVNMLCGGISATGSIPMVKEKIKLSKKYNGYSSQQIWIRFLLDIPKGWIKNIIRRNPKLWYKMIGCERCVDNIGKSSNL